MGAGVADRGADARARRRTFDVVGCGATLRREHDPVDRIVLLPQALSPAHGAPPTDTTRVTPLPLSLRPGWCCKTRDARVDAEDRHHRRRRSRHEGYPSPEAHPPTSTGALARRSCRSLCRRADDGLVSTPRGARNTRVSMTPEIFARSIQFSIRHRRDARNRKRGFESAPSLSRWRIAAPDIFFPPPAKANKHTHREREAFARRSHPDRSAVPPRNSNNNDRQGYRQGALDDRPNLARVASAVGRRSTG